MPTKDRRSSVVVSWGVRWVIIFAFSLHVCRVNAQNRRIFIGRKAFVSSVTEGRHANDPCDRRSRLSGGGSEASQMCVNGLVVLAADAAPTECALSPVLYIHRSSYTIVERPDKIRCI